MAPIWRIAAVYSFAPVADPSELVGRLRAFGYREGWRGTLIVAEEGLNGTVAGTPGAIDEFVAVLDRDGRFAEREIKFADASEEPFRRFKVHRKREIVTMGVGELDVSGGRGRYVDPEDWNDVIANPEVQVVDTRNRFEVAIGTFDGATDPGTDDFSEFPEWAHRNLDPSRPVAMFCTGGVRCEKASTYLQANGFADVRHLHGGILRYLEEVTQEETKWSGSCFVFDERVGVGHGLRQTGHSVCRSCRMPLSAQDRTHEDYDDQVACPYCAPTLRPEDRARRVERREQTRRASARGETHVGADLDAQRARKKREREAHRERSLTTRVPSGRRPASVD